MLPRADRRAPRSQSLLTRLATKPDEKCGLALFFLLLLFSLTITEAGTSWRRNSRRSTDSADSAMVISSARIASAF
jgi:hypothetical protein